MIYIYNQPLVPRDSKQYKIYEKLYGYQDFWNFNTDMKNAFYKWKYNNASVNEVYKKFVVSIK